VEVIEVAAVAGEAMAAPEPVARGAGMATREMTATAHVATADMTAATTAVHRRRVTRAGGRQHENGRDD
jgi:hypothetical protein